MIEKSNFGIENFWVDEKNGTVSLHRTLESALRREVSVMKNPIPESEAMEGLRDQIKNSVGHFD